MTTVSGECSICLSSNATHAIIPCGHVCACGDCISSLSSCPICRVAAKSTMRIYLPGAPPTSPAAPFSPKPLTVNKPKQEEVAAPAAPAVRNTDLTLEKQEIGEALYPLVYAVVPFLAAKITGMLLDLPNSELLSLIADRYLLRGRIEEAKAVLAKYSPLGGGAAAAPRPRNPLAASKNPTPSTAPLFGGGVAAPQKFVKALPCKYFASGNCNKGAACTFSHSSSPLGGGEGVVRAAFEDKDDDGGSSVSSSVGSRAACTFFMKGNCAEGAGCRFSHEVCPLGMQCKDWSCAYSDDCHPRNRTVRCWYAEKCTDSKCTFLHPPNRPHKFSLQSAAKRPTLVGAPQPKLPSPSDSVVMPARGPNGSMGNGMPLARPAASSSMFGGGASRAGW